MIDAALATGDAAKVRTVIELAKATNPDDAAALDAILAAFETELAATQAKAAEAKTAAASETETASSGIFEDWSGRGELGGFTSSGNAENTGFTASLALTKEGVNWRHKLSGRADYQETQGTVTREQFLAAFELNLKISERSYLYKLTQYERDRFQGFSARYSVSGGLGYDVLTEGPTLTFDAGPAWRRTELVDGQSSTSLAGRASLDFDWRLSDSLTLTQNASVLAQDGSSTLTSDTGFQVGLSDALSVRLSYTVEHDTAPPEGAVSTDTLSRVTIIYGF